MNDATQVSLGFGTNATQRKLTAPKRTVEDAIRRAPKA
jgi:hypothetical protein